MNLDLLTFNVEVPPVELHPNGRAHWRVKAKSVKQYHERNRIPIRDRKRLYKCPIESALVLLEYVLPSGLPQHQHDKDNLVAWAKPAIDALEAEGVVVNDRHLLYKTPRQIVGKSSLRIKLFPLDGEAGDLVKLIVSHAKAAFPDESVKAWIEQVMGFDVD